MVPNWLFLFWFRGKPGEFLTLDMLLASAHLQKRNDYHLGCLNDQPSFFTVEIFSNKDKIVQSVLRNKNILDWPRCSSLLLLHGWLLLFQVIFLKGTCSGHPLQCSRLHQLSLSSTFCQPTRFIYFFSLFHGTCHFPNY